MRKCFVQIPLGADLDAEEVFFARKCFVQIPLEADLDAEGVFYCAEMLCANTS